MTGYRLILILLIFPAACGTSAAQNRQEDPLEQLFADGLSEFKAARYASAAAAFGSVVDARGRNPRSTAALIMAAKSEYRSGRFDQARIRATTLLDRFPRSTYADEALYVLSLSEFRLGSHDLAAADLVTLLRLHPASALAGRATDLFSVIASSNLPLSELKRLTGMALPPGLHTTAAMALANAHVRRGEDTLALSVLDDLLVHPDATGSLGEIASLREDIAAGEGIQVAALLPLMGDTPDSDVGRIGKELLDGIRFAADGYNAGVSRGRRVEILARDTGRDTARSAALVRELAVSPGVRAVIGPVFSDIFSAASQAANALHLPIISPTATADRLAAIGPFIFQANPDNTTRGRAVARYAVSELRMSSFAVMASDEPVGRSHAEAFAREAEALGATVYCTVYFPPDASDLREAFLSVRRAVMAEGTLVHRADLLKPRFRPALEAFGIDSLHAADSLLAAGDSVAGPFVSVTTVFGPRGYAIAESLGLPIAMPDTSAEETDVPMVSADGIFIALGDPGQLDYVAPQLNYFNIRAQVLGNNEWNDPDRLRDNRESVEGARFVSDSRFPDADSATNAFSAAFAAQSGRKPTKFTLYGYDVMNLILEQVRSGARTRADIASRLADVNGYRGLHSEITLRGGRVNRYLHVMEYFRGAIRRVGSVTVGEP